MRFSLFAFLGLATFAVADSNLQHEDINPWSANTNINGGPGSLPNGGASPWGGANSPLPGGAINPTANNFGPNNFGSRLPTVFGGSGNPNFNNNLARPGFNGNNNFGANFNGVNGNRVPQGAGKRRRNRRRRNNRGRGNNFNRGNLRSQLSNEYAD